MTEERPTRFDHLRRKEADGTHEGGLAALVAGLGGVVTTAALIPGALTSFWVWMLILTGGIAMGAVGQAIAQWNNLRKDRKA